MRRTLPRQAAVALTGLPILAIITLAGCSSGATSSSSASSAVSARSAALAPKAAAGGADAGTAKGGVANAPSAGAPSLAGGPAKTTSSERIARSGAQLIYTAQLTVHARDVQTAVTRATAIVTGGGGYISAENDSTDPAHPDQSSATLGLKIPVAAYAATLAQLDSGSLGTQQSLQQQAQDVTQQVADVSSQVTSDEAAIAQLRSLLTYAGSVADLLSVQNQINSEESGLESLLAQQKALDSETAYATVTVTIHGPKRVASLATKTRPKPPPGLADGLSGGWRAFRLTVDWLLAVVGAVAPFAAALAVIGYLGYWLRRRSRSASRGEMVP